MRELREADVVMFESSLPPPAEAEWKTATLPDAWTASRPGLGGDVWYRLRLDLTEAPREAQAVYLPRLCMNAAVFLNGMLLGDGGSFDDPAARNWNRPLLFPIPPGLLKSGQNTLFVRVFSPHFSPGGFSTVSVGAAKILQAEYERKFFWRITLNQTASLLIVAIGLFMLALWWQRRQDTMYGFFGLSALVWAFNSSNLFLQTVPVSARLWETLIAASFEVLVALLMISLLRFLGLKKPLLEKLLWLMLFAAPSSLLLLPDVWLFPVSMAWHLVTLICSLSVGGLLLRTALQKPQLDTLLLIAALGINIVFGFHDWLNQTAILEAGVAHWLHYGAPIFFLVVGGILTKRFVQALNQYERLNTELEQRVNTKRMELEAQYHTMREMEKQRNQMEERERIYRDLHDDVGAKLMGLAIAAQRAELPNEADLAFSALHDLRDVVSRSAQTSTPLTDLLADLRIEARQRAEAAGLLLEWNAACPQLENQVNPETALNLSRLVREAITNIMRHAHASHIDIRLHCDEQNLILEISDDGIGLPQEETKPHRGMKGMLSRAAALNATLRWHSLQPHGCRVELTLPLAVLHQRIEPMEAQPE